MRLWYVAQMNRTGLAYVMAVILGALATWH